MEIQFVKVLMESWRVSLDWEHQVNSLVKRFVWENWRLEETMYGGLPWLEEQIDEKNGHFKVIFFLYSVLENVHTTTYK